MCQWLAFIHVFICVFCKIVFCFSNCFGFRFEHTFLTTPKYKLYHFANLSLHLWNIEHSFENNFTPWKLPLMCLPLCLDPWSQHASQDQGWMEGRSRFVCPTIESCTFLLNNNKKKKTSKHTINGSCNHSLLHC